jgi:hypothetical protein
MARTRNIYQVDTLYVLTGANTATGAHFAGAAYGGTPTGQSLLGTSPVTGRDNFVASLFRVQKADYDWAKTLTDVNQFGELAAIDRVPLQQPTVNLSFSYLLSNLINENRIGLTVASAGTASQVSCLSGILNGTTDVKNYFIKTVGEGNDSVGTSGTSFIIAIGNGFFNSYSLNAAVGGFPTVDVSVQALNIQGQNYTNGSGITIPAVIPTDGSAITGWYYTVPPATESAAAGAINSTNSILSVLRPGDITFSLGFNAGDGFFDETDLKIQNFTLSFDTRRQDLQKLGSKYAFAKVIQFPLTATLNINAIVGEYQTGNLINIVNDNESYNPTININKPGTSTSIAWFQLQGAKLDNQNITSSIGPDKQLSMTFSTQIAGPSDLTHGLFLSGVIN